MSERRLGPDLSKILQETRNTGVTDLELTIGTEGKKGYFHLLLTRSTPQQKPSPEQEDQGKIEGSKNLYHISNPLNGIFWRKPRPEDPPYVETGDWVEPEQILCVIEAFKIFNEIKAEVSGRIHEIIVTDGSEAKKGDILMIVDTSATKPIP